MSQFHERKEKNCLNCNSEVVGRYCHVCGQENVELKESFWHLITHFIAHEFHYDSKFISSVKYLMFKPGFLSKEYFKGKRASYLDPIRMYIFISAAFFLVLFSILKHSAHANNPSEEHKTNVVQVTEKLDEKKEKLNEQLESDDVDSTKKVALQKKKIEIEKLAAALQKDTTKADSILKSLIPIQKRNLTIGWTDENYKTLEEYKQKQQLLPSNQRDNWLTSFIITKSLEISKKYDENPHEFKTHFTEELLHSTSEMLFVSLPFFALILQLLYIRRRKHLFYVQHFIYTIHLYCATFIFMFCSLLVDSLKEIPYFHWIDYLQFGLFIYWIYYCYKSIKVYYGQSRRKTLFKFMLLFFSFLILLLFLFIIFAFISALNT